MSEQVATDRTDAGSAHVTVPASDLGRVLYNAGLFVSKDDTRPILTCVHVRVEASVSVTNAAGTLIAEGTDAYVLGEDSFPVVIRGDVGRSYLLPAAGRFPSECGDGLRFPFERQAGQG